MKKVVLDFETYYSEEYTLSTLSTAGYIRDPRFQAIGFSLKVDAGPTVWYTGSDEHIKASLPTQAWWNDAILVAHNTMFDGGILSLRYGIRPAFQCCTMSMARSLGMDFSAGGSLKGLADTFRRHVDPSMPHKGDEVIKAFGKRRTDFTAEELAAYGTYCCTDTDITARLFDIMAPHISAAELRWQDIVIRMFTEPVFELDTQMLEDEAVRVRDRKAALMAKLIESLGVGDEATLKEHLGSSVKFAQVLTALGIDPPTKISQTTGKPTFAFAKSDEGMKALMEHSDPVVQLLASVRLSTKSTIEESRVEKFIMLSKLGAWSIPYNVSGAHTHRLSGSDGQNPQNLPSGRIPGQSTALRRSIMAPAGHVVIAGDSAQVEARVLAFIAQQKDLLAAFEVGTDTYKQMASRIYSVTLEAVTAAQRQVGKSARLGAGFGIGAAKFRDYVRTTTGLILTLGECQQIIDAYRQSNAQIVALWKQCDQVLRNMIAGGTGLFGGPNNDLFYYDGKRELFGVPVPGILGPDGMWINYPELRLETEERIDARTGEITERNVIVYTKSLGRRKLRKYTYGAKVVENITQYLAFALMKWQAVRIGKRYPVRLNSHDEHAITCIARHADSAKAFMTECMRAVPLWLEGCPINCEVNVAHRYGDC